MLHLRPFTNLIVCALFLAYPTERIQNKFLPIVDEVRPSTQVFRLPFLLTNLFTPSDYRMGQQVHVAFEWSMPRALRGMFDTENGAVTSSYMPALLKVQWAMSISEGSARRKWRSKSTFGFTIHAPPKVPSLKYWVPFQYVSLPVRSDRYLLTDNVTYILG